MKERKDVDQSTYSEGWSNGG